MIELNKQKTEPSATSESRIEKQVAEWRAEVVRLQDLIAHATGAPAVTVDTQRPAHYYAGDLSPEACVFLLHDAIAWATRQAREGFNEGAKVVEEIIGERDAARAALAQRAGSDETKYDSGRQQGRAEALAILMQLDPENGIDEYTGWSAPVGPEDEGSAYWDEPKLRELFAADGALADMMDKAEGEYWHYKGLQDEAEHARNFAANMHSSGKVREVLAKAGEFDLMGLLCAAPPSQPAGERLAQLREWLAATGALPKGSSWIGELEQIVVGAGERAQQPGSERDAARLDWLEQMANEPEGLLLHDGGDFTGRHGLGLRRIGRTLRQAIDAAMAAHQCEKSPPLQFVVMGDSESSPDPLLADMHNRIKSQGEKGSAK